jgi:lipopolysaccharide transport system ATP-binding protein
MSTVIKVEDLSKQYRLGLVGSGTFKEDVAKWWAKLNGKENPYSLLGEENDRSIKGESNYVWSLKDINFQVEQGDVLGIIGKNGAGKSTLLKILSKVTSPTTGTVKAKGRIASLLEVGTGFHPELTGRENIYLNGAILGMRKSEISRKLDEIIVFAGVERYIDTPVKRYSSGMYVRLAFAVAAHLESEILIIDEVLAVGDAEFQKKCIGKMKNVSEDGRTILFVSHAIESVKKLCNKGILLKNGLVSCQGDIGQVLNEYMKVDVGVEETGVIPYDADRYNTGEAKFTKVRLLDKNGDKIKNIFYKQNFVIELEIELFDKLDSFTFYVIINDSHKDKVGFITSDGKFNNVELEKGTHTLNVFFENNLLEGEYSLTIAFCHYPSGADIDIVEHSTNFIVNKIAEFGKENFTWTKHGHFLLESEFNLV